MLSEKPDQLLPIEAHGLNSEHDKSRDGLEENEKALVRKN